MFWININSLINAENYIDYFKFMLGIAFFNVKYNLIVRCPNLRLVACGYYWRVNVVMNVEVYFNHTTNMYTFVFV